MIGLPGTNIALGTTSPHQDTALAPAARDSIRKIAQMMRDLDFCMLTTTSDDGRLHSRPMSNNGEVEFDGDVWFFSAADSRKIEEIEENPEVELSYADTKRFLRETRA